jgi:hypothetical protein
LSGLRVPSADVRGSAVGAVVGELSRTSIGVARLVGAAETSQEFGPGRTRVAEVVETELVDYAKAGLGAFGLGDCDGAVE